MSRALRRAGMINKGREGVNGNWDLPFLDWENGIYCTGSWI